MELIDFILHVDEHLLEFIYQLWHLDLCHLFLIIFVETGLVVMPFFTRRQPVVRCGCAGCVNRCHGPMGTPEFCCFIAAVLGDTVNYHIAAALARVYLKSTHVLSISSI